MLIIGCDFHTRYQQIAMMDDATGELTERRLEHQSGEADTFYRNLQPPVRVGIEATGPIHWRVANPPRGEGSWAGDAILSALKSLGWPTLCGFGPPAAGRQRLSRLLRCITACASVRNSHHFVV